MSIADLTDSSDVDLSAIDLHLVDSTKQSMLQKAIAARKLQLARAILKQDVDLNYQDRLGYTAFAYAITHGDPELALLIANKGFDVSLEDRDGNTALWFAAMHDPHNEKLRDRLLELGSDLEHQNKFGSRPRDVYEAMGVKN